MPDNLIHLEDNSFLLDFTSRLSREWKPGDGYEGLSESLKREVFLVEDLSKRTNRVYSIFDRERFGFVFHTWNLFALAGLPEGQKWEMSSLKVLQDPGIVKTFVSVMLKVAARLDALERTMLNTCVCGAATRNLKDQLLRLHYIHHPFSFDENGFPVLSFGSVADVKSLMTSDTGFWIRFSAGQKIFHWHSHTGELAARDIVTPREKEIIGLWHSGLSIPDIAEKLYVSVVTVKNQLNNARRRVLARDNTALAEICRVTGILPSIL